MLAEDPKELFKADLRRRLRSLRAEGKATPPKVEGVEPNFRTACVLNPNLNKPQV